MQDQRSEISFESALRTYPWRFTFTIHKINCRDCCMQSSTLKLHKNNAIVGERIDEQQQLSLSCTIQSHRAFFRCYREYAHQKHRVGTSNVRFQEFWIVLRFYRVPKILYKCGIVAIDLAVVYMMERTYDLVTTSRSQIIRQSGSLNRMSFWKESILKF